MLIWRKDFCRISNQPKAESDHHRTFLNTPSLHRLTHSKVENHLHRQDERCLALFEFQGRTYQLTSEPSPPDDEEYESDDDEPPPLEPIAEAGQTPSLASQPLQNPPPYTLQTTTEYAHQGRTLLPQLLRITDPTDQDTGFNVARPYIDMLPGPGARNVLNLTASSTPNTFTWNDATGRPRLLVECQGRGLAIIRCANLVSLQYAQILDDHSPSLCRMTTFTSLAIRASLCRHEL